MDGRYVTRTEGAAALQVHPRTFDKLVKRGFVQPYKIEGVKGKRFLLSEILAVPKKVEI